MAEYIDMTPKWSEVAPQLMALLRQGTEEGVQFAREEFMKMAEAADCVPPNIAKPKPSPRLMLHMARSVR